MRATDHNTMGEMTPKTSSSAKPSGPDLIHDTLGIQHTADCTHTKRCLEHFSSSAGLVVMFNRQTDRQTCRQTYFPHSSTFPPWRFSVCTLCAHLCIVHAHTHTHTHTHTDRQTDGETGRRRPVWSAGRRRSASRGRRWSRTPVRPPCAASTSS